MYKPKRFGTLVKRLKHKLVTARLKVFMYMREEEVEVEVEKETNNIATKLSRFSKKILKRYGLETVLINDHYLATTKDLAESRSKGKFIRSLRRHIKEMESIAEIKKKNFYKSILIKNCKTCYLKGRPCAKFFSVVEIDKVPMIDFLYILCHDDDVDLSPYVDRVFAVFNNVKDALEFAVEELRKESFVYFVYLTHLEDFVEERLDVIKFMIYAYRKVGELDGIRETLLREDYLSVERLKKLIECGSNKSDF